MRKTLSAPLDVQFDITRKCQLDCSYCCATPLDGTHADTASAVRLLAELGRSGIISILLSGGEATLHPDFLDILHAAYRNIPMISFGSNGIRLSRGSLAKEVKSIAPSVLVTISLDSLNATTHNAHRGAGYSHAIRAIDKCLEANIELNISCVVTDTNVDSAHEIVERYDKQIKKFSFFPRVPRNESELFRIIHVFWRNLIYYWKPSSQLKMAIAVLM